MVDAFFLTSFRDGTDFLINPEGFGGISAVVVESNEQTQMCYVRLRVVLIEFELRLFLSQSVSCYHYSQRNVCGRVCSFSFMAIKHLSDGQLDKIVALQPNCSNQMSTLKCKTKTSRPDLRQWQLEQRNDLAWTSTLNPGSANAAKVFLV